MSVSVASGVAATDAVRAQTDPVTGGIVFSGPRGPIHQSLPPLRRKGAVVCDWQSATGAVTLSAGAGAAAAVDTGVQLFGKPTLKCTFSTAASDTFIATFTPTNPLRLRDVQTIQVPVLFTSNAALGGVGAGASPFQVWLGTSNAKSIRLQGYFSKFRRGVWNTISFGRGSTNITNHQLTELDAAGVTVTTIKIVQATNNAAANANPVWVGEIRADAAAAKGVVSIVMDGEYSSQYSVLYPLMQANRLVSSLAITNSDIGGSGRMTLAQIQEMYAAGHECIHHTFNAAKQGGYGNATDWPAAADIAEDIRAQWAYFAANGLTAGIGFGVHGFTDPFTATNTDARQSIVADGLMAAGLVGVRKSSPYQGDDSGGVLQNISGTPYDGLLITGGIQITNTHSAANVQAIIDKAEATGQWGIITIHRSSETPGSLEMTAANFSTWMSHLATRVTAGGVENLTFSDAFRRHMAQV